MSIEESESILKLKRSRTDRICVASGDKMADGSHRPFVWASRRRVRVVHQRQDRVVGLRISALVDVDRMSLYAYRRTERQRDKTRWVGGRTGTASVNDVALSATRYSAISDAWQIGLLHRGDTSGVIIGGPLRVCLLADAFARFAVRVLVWVVACVFVFSAVPCFLVCLQSFGFPCVLEHECVCYSACIYFVRVFWCVCVCVCSRARVCVRVWVCGRGCMFLVSE